MHTHQEDLEPHDPLQQNLEENAADSLVTETILDETETTPAEESAVNSDNQTAKQADYSLATRGKAR